MKTLIFSTTAAVALMFANTDAAQANSKFQISIGGGGFGHSGGFHNPGFGGGHKPVGHGHGGHIHGGHVHGGHVHGGHMHGGHVHHGVNPHIPTGPSGHLHWHDTSHYHYIPGRWVQQGCHRVWVPGRKVLHRDGHFDLHH